MLNKTIIIIIFNSFKPKNEKYITKQVVYQELLLYLILSKVGI